MHFTRESQNPMRLFGPATASLKDWKWAYANNDFDDVALPYFMYEFFPETEIEKPRESSNGEQKAHDEEQKKAPTDAEWTLWKLEYAYNTELGELYQSKNLLNGFFERLLENVEYIFAVGAVYGEDNDNGIIIVALIRGCSYKDAFKVAPEWDTYTYTPLDLDNESDLQLLKEVWSRDSRTVLLGAVRAIRSRRLLTGGPGNTLEYAHDVMWE